MMESMTDKITKLSRAQGDLEANLDKVTSTAAADHDLTQALQVHTYVYVDLPVCVLHQISSTKVPDASVLSILMNDVGR